MFFLPSDQDKENNGGNGTDAEKNILDSSTNFSQLYKNLAESKLMPSKMSENLSVPLAFVALLHLCNERCLALVGLPDFSDFSVRQGWCLWINDHNYMRKQNLPM